MEKNDVASFFYYMWNAWCEEECKIVFAESKCGWRHFWEKWNGICYKLRTSRGAAEEFFAELSDYNQDLLVKRAIEVYNRKQIIK